MWPTESCLGPKLVGVAFTFGGQPEWCDLPECQAWLFWNLGLQLLYSICLGAGLQDRVLSTVLLSPSLSSFIPASLPPEEAPGSYNFPSQFSEYRHFFQISRGSIPNPDFSVSPPLPIPEYQFSLPSLKTFLVGPSIHFPTHFLSIHLFTHQANHTFVY